MKNSQIAKNNFDLFRVMDIPAVIDYVIVQTSRGKSKSDYLKSFTELIDVNLNSFSDILAQIHQGTIFVNEFLGSVRHGSQDIKVRMI